MDTTAQADDADLVRAARAGDGQAFGVLFDRWFDRVNDVAYRIVRDREVAAEVAQDAFLAAWTGLDGLEQVDSFGGWLLRIGRNRALNRLERERRSIAIGDEETTAMLDRDQPDHDEATAAASRAEDVELVWAAAAALGPRDTSVLDLHLRHGLSAAEIADELGVAPNNAHQILFRLRNRLGEAVRAWVLWHSGRPACARLGSELAGAEVTTFGSDAVRIITAHAAECGDCSARRDARLAPEALFAAAPLLVAGSAVREAVRRGLADGGVPIGPAGPPTPASEHVGERFASDSPSEATERGGLDAGREVRRRALGASAAGVVVLVVAAILLLTGDDSDPVDAVAASEPTTTPPSSATTAVPGPTATSTTAPGPGQTLTGPDPTVAPPEPLPAPAPTEGQGPAGPQPDIATTTTPPPVIVDPGPGPTTTSTTTATPPTPPAPPPPPPDPPTIISFTATRVPGPGCTTPSARVALSWRTSGADQVGIAGPGAPAGDRPAFGTAVACSPGPAAYVLSATGAGGTVTRAATA